MRFNRLPDFAIGAQPALAVHEWTQIWRRPMMKIETIEVDGVLILQVEGRLAGAFVLELERCWQAARADQPARRISVDLKGVTCIDRLGRYLLLLMHGSGVGFLRAGLAVQDILDQVIAQQECKQ
jgi:hypothetical protein